MAKRNWDRLKNRSAGETLRNRDVYESQQLDRTQIGHKQSFALRHFFAIFLGLLTAVIIWAIWSAVDIKTLDTKSDNDIGIAVDIVQQAPDEPRDLADVTWANMILVENKTYAKYGYVYMDTRTGIKYTQAEYNIWLDVRRKIESGMCYDLIETVNKDGTYSYKEREVIAPAPDTPRKFTDAEYINFVLAGIEADDLYKDMGYTHKENYSGQYLTYQEYAKSREYTHDQIQSLIDRGRVGFREETRMKNNGENYVVQIFYDIDKNAPVPQIPESEAGSRYTTPIELDNVTWLNMRLVEDNSAAKLGYSYRDERTGQYYTKVEYSYWNDLRNKAIGYYKGYVYWIELNPQDKKYQFSETPAGYAADNPREWFEDYLATDFMQMNMVSNTYWQEYGYLYYDAVTKMFYSEAEYQEWLSVQNKIASGEIRIPKETQKIIRKQKEAPSDVVAAHLDPLPIRHTYMDGFKYFHFYKFIVSLAAGLAVYSIMRALLKKNLDAQNLMNDTSDINQYENDQHIALPEEVQRKFDWFPDVGAHCPVQVSSMISHMMLTNKGLNKIKFAKRAEKDIVDQDGDIVYYKGEMLYDEKGEVMTETLPLIDSKFANELYEASGAPKEFRKYYDANKIPYNPDGKDRTKQCGTHKTVADAINKTWTFPLYEPQRPAGAYIVDTEPVNTMVLAMENYGVINA